MQSNRPGLKSQDAQLSVPHVNYLRLPCLEQEEKMSRRLPLVLTLSVKDTMIGWSAEAIHLCEND